MYSNRIVRGTPFDANRNNMSSYSHVPTNRVINGSLLDELLPTTDQGNRAFQIKVVIDNESILKLAGVGFGLIIANTIINNSKPKR